MWHDGQFTYLRSRAQESPALYELRDGEPALVAYDLSEDGLYIARHVLGDGWLQIGDKRAAWRFHAAGSAPMSRWKQWVSPPEGALPGGIVTKGGVVLIAVLVGGLLFSWAVTGPQEADTLVALPEAQAVDDGMGRSLRNRIRQEAERQTLEAAARARAELERRQAAAAGEMARLQTESETPNTAALIPGVSAGRVGASGGASAGGAGAKNPLAPCPSRGSVVQGSGRRDPAVRTRRRCGRRGCGPPREHGSSGARLFRAVGRGARERIGRRPGGRTASPRVPWHRRCCGARVRAASLPSGTEPDSARA